MIDGKFKELLIDSDKLNCETPSCDLASSIMSSRKLSFDESESSHEKSNDYEKESSDYKGEVEINETVVSNEEDKKK